MEISGLKLNYRRSCIFEISNSLEESFTGFINDNNKNHGNNNNSDIIFIQVKLVQQQCVVINQGPV